MQVRRTAIAARSASRASAAHLKLTPSCRFRTSRRVFPARRSRPPSFLAPIRGATTASRAPQQRTSHSHESAASHTTASRQRLAAAQLRAHRPRSKLASSGISIHTLPATNLLRRYSEHPAGCLFNRKVAAHHTVAPRALQQLQSCCIEHSTPAPLRRHAIHRTPSINIIASARALMPGQVSGSRARLPRHHFGAGSRARPGQRLSRALASSSLWRRLSRPRQVRRSSTHVTSSQQSHTPHAGCRSAGPRCGLSRLRL